MFWNKGGKKLLKRMELGKEYTVSELYQLLYNKKGDYSDYEYFDLYILTWLEINKKISINYDNTWTIKKL